MKNNNFRMPAASIWENFQQSLMTAIERGEHQEQQDLAYWQDKVFKKIILYALPLSSITAIPSILIKYLQGYKYVPLIDISVVLAISLVVFSGYFSLSFKKKFVAVALTFLSIVLITMLGSFGLGSIYLLSIAAYAALLFSRGAAYLTVIVNAVIYALLGMVIYWKPFDMPLIHAYTAGTWIAYSLNFVFLNVVIVSTISYVLDGIERTLQDKVQLLGQLEEKLIEINSRNQQLQESEEHYKSLFYLNPSPMWIFDIDTLQILQVNEAAVLKYKYTEPEFLCMTFENICTPEALTELLTGLKQPAKKEGERLVTQHRYKDGENVSIELRCNTIPLDGKECRLAIGRDITQQLNHIKAIEEQNQKLREIAFMQSHVIRAPLARIMGLSGLITQNLTAPPDPQVLSYLDISVKELDQVIKSIINNSGEILPAGLTNSDTGTLEESESNNV
ncbi:PAS domain S-box protein [Mucilaginibacter sp. Bleaf8]|uniref:PAS domain-containing protein n=1 Tax=Mucilaginibacter sp. Bleaf8 TaxID=2834430 RepID=UPI001BCAEBA6|nr:PAS domain-containing protein [Mucilaginibacter sp. Bleaf8]MBS7566291.1 PAS domain S-box protein [Mucilaginibacter sp. Bleaf8]